MKTVWHILMIQCKYPPHVFFLSTVCICLTCCNKLHALFILLCSIVSLLILHFHIFNYLQNVLRLDAKSHWKLAALIHLLYHSTAENKSISASITVKTAHNAKGFYWWSVWTLALFSGLLLSMLNDHCLYSLITLTVALLHNAKYDRNIESVSFINA